MRIYTFNFMWSREPGFMLVDVWTDDKRPMIRRPFDIMTKKPCDWRFFGITSTNLPLKYIMPEWVNPFLCHEIFMRTELRRDHMQEYGNYLHIPQKQDALTLVVWRQSFGKVRIVER